MRLCSAGVALARGLEAAGSASRLRDLNLARNPLGDAAAEAFGRALAAQGPQGALRDLSLDDTRIGPRGAKGLADGLRINSCLEILALDSTLIGAKGAGAVVGGISGADGWVSGVRSLSLINNELGNEGLVAMFSAGLMRNDTLLELDVGDNQITGEGCLHLAQWAERRIAAARANLPSSGGGGAAKSAGGGVHPRLLTGEQRWPASSRPLAIRACGNPLGDEVFRQAILHRVKLVNEEAIAAGWWKSMGALEFDIDEDDSVEEENEEDDGGDEDDDEDGDDDYYSDSM